MTTAFALGLTAVLSLGIVPWGASPVAAEAAGDPVVTFGWPTVSATKVAAGARVTISINAQGKSLDTPGALTYVVRAIDLAGASTEIDRQENVTFTAWQTRRFTSSWRIPDTFRLGISTVRFEMIAASGTVVAARDGAVAVLTADDGGSAPPATPAPTRTATPTPTSPPPPTVTPTPTSPPATGGGAGRPPRRCDQEFQIVGSADFVSSIWSQLATISSVSPADYNRTMSCYTDPSTGRTMTEVRRIVQSDPPYSTVNGYAYYSDSSGTIWTRKGVGPLAASQVVHEAAHITTTGWNMPGGSCEPENRTLEIQAQFLDRAADQQAEPAQASALRFYADWYRQQKNRHNCPA